MALQSFSSESPKKQERKSIYRTSKRRNYTAVSNDLARDTTLSYEAKGLLLTILSLPEDWEVRFEWMKRQCQEPIGKDRLQRMLRELIQSGYLVREVHRVKGRFASEYRFYDTPQTPDRSTLEGSTEDGVTEPSKPQRFTRRGSTAADNPALYKVPIDKPSDDFSSHQNIIVTTTKQTKGGGGAKLSLEQEEIIHTIAEWLSQVNWKEGKLPPDDHYLYQTSHALAKRYQWDLNRLCLAVQDEVSWAHRLNKTLDGFRQSVKL